MGKDVYHGHISNFVRGFINDRVLTHHKRENIRAIVIAGEASTTAIELLGGAAREAVGHEQVELITDIEPSEVVAHGAAVWARTIREKSENFGSSCEGMFDDEYYPRPHDEL